MPSRTCAKRPAPTLFSGFFDAPSRTTHAVVALALRAAGMVERTPDRRSHHGRAVTLRCPSRQLHRAASPPCRRADHPRAPGVRVHPRRVERHDRQAPGGDRALRRCGRRRPRRPLRRRARGADRGPRRRPQRCGHRCGQRRAGDRPVVHARRAHRQRRPHGARAGRRHVGGRGQRDRAARTRRSRRGRVGDRRGRAGAQRRGLPPTTPGRDDGRQPRLRRGRPRRRPSRARERRRAFRSVSGLCAAAAATSAWSPPSSCACTSSARRCSA